MTKAELIEKIQSQMQLIDDRSVSKADVDSLLRTLETTVQDELRKDGELTLPGIGKLSVGERAARTGRNPQTGEVIQIAATKTVKFKPLKVLKDAVK